GALVAVATATVRGWSRAAPDRSALTRLGLRTILLGVLPAYVLMRVGAEWTEAVADYPDDFDPTWLGIGYVIADVGALLTIVSVVLAGIGLRRLRRGGGLGLGRAAGVIAVLLLGAYLVAVWAMTAKPG
ncbi:MAG: hypothetical protein ACRDNX_01675, partial [Gaiellaceae bacterium]